MSRRCPDCGHLNDDSRIFCASCGEPLDSHIRLVQGLRKEAHKASQNSTASESASDKRKNVRDDDDDYVYVPKKSTQKTKSYTRLWIILGIIVVIVVAFIFLRK